jgi:glycosyltransferase involved in cell wall biosynthesis
MRRVWEDDALRAAMARKGLERAEEFRWERIIPKVVDVYREALETYPEGEQRAT